MRRYLITVLLFTCLPVFADAKSGTSIYVCAHPDDCILFMNPNLYDDVTHDADKVVTVFLTSGDAGLPFSQEGTTASYPYVREQASVDAMEWMVDAGKSKTTAQLDTEMTEVAGHIIERVSYGNTVTYFLRLPDGNFDGNGFPLYNHESLRKLKAGEIDTMTPVDGEAAYSWKDMVSVLSGIVTREAGDDKQLTLHIQEPDTSVNTDDHSDHTTTARGMLEALVGDSTGRCNTVYKHIDYSIATKPLNLEGTALQDKSASFAVLTATERHFLDHADWNEGHTAYLTRNYFTTMTLPQGCDKAKPH